MTNYLKYLGLGTAGFVFASVAYFAWRLYDLAYDLDEHRCGNQILGSYPSPGGLKKVVLFVSDCGATTAFFVHASIMAPAEELHNADRGNIFVADGNHGAAAEYNRIGGPAIKIAWTDGNELEIRYSQGARIFLEIPQFGETHISYSSF
jgi:hypothetical protein